MSDRATILATDLDGTFLGGTDHERAALYSRVREDEYLRLVFVTGRDLDFVRSIVGCGLVPAPEFVIGDVGTTVVTGPPNYEPVAAVQTDIDALWDDASERVMALLADEPTLRLQPGDWRARRRVSYYYDPATLDPAVVERVRALGFDVILSADVYLDVMPRGVSKGPTLRRLVDWAGWDAERVLAAGDTLNDVTLLTAGFNAVAVGNSEPALVERVADHPSVYRAQGNGAAGVLEALTHFSLLHAQ